MHTNMHAAIYTYQLQDQYWSSTTHACQALIDQSIRHFGINYTSVRLDTMGLEILGTTQL